MRSPIADGFLLLGGPIVPAVPRPSLMLDPPGDRALIAVRAFSPQAPVRIYALERDRVSQRPEVYFGSHAGELIGQPVAFVGPNGPEVICLTREAILRSPLSDPSRVEAHDATMLLPFAEGVCATVDPDTGNILVLVPEGPDALLFELAGGSLRCRGRVQVMICLLAGPGMGVIGVGVTSSQSTIYRLRGVQLERLAAFPRPLIHAATLDPRRGALAVLRTSKRSRGGLLVHHLRGDVLEEEKGGVRLPFAVAPSFVCAADGAIYHHVGLEGPGSAGNEGSYVVLSGATEASRLTAGFSLPRPGTYRSLVGTESGLVAVDHATGEQWSYSPSGFDPRGRETSARWDARSVQVASAPDRLFALAAGGAIFESAGAGWRPLGDGRGGPGWHYSHRTAFAYDATSHSLLVFGGFERNDAWLWSLESSRFTELDLDLRPPHGMAAAVSTRLGVFVLVEDGTLWRFASGAFTIVATGLPNRRLIFDPTEERLFAVGASASGDHAPCTFYVIDDRGAAHELSPSPVPVGKLWSHVAEVGFDVTSRSLVVLTAGQCWALPIPRDLPRGLPTQAVERPRRRRAPEREWIRRAAAIQIDGEIAERPELDLPDGAKLLALLPREEGVGPGADYAAALLWTSAGCNAPLVEGKLLSQWPQGLVRAPIVVSEGGFAHRGRYELFDDVDPNRVLLYDTPSARTRDLARSSKLGGYPARIQEGPEPEGAAFLLQLTGGSFRWGDLGRVLVYVRDGRLEAVLETC